MHQMTLPMGDDSGSDRGPKPVPVHVGNVPVNSSVSGEDQKRLAARAAITTGSGRDRGSGPGAIVRNPVAAAGIKSNIDICVG